MSTLDQTQGLVVFVRVVQAGSFSAAARNLGLAPSAVSKSIARLEHRLGVRLFQRSTRSHTLTREGGQYYDMVEPLLRSLDQATEIVSAPRELEGTLRIAAPAVLANALATPLTSEFAPRHPRLHLEFAVSDRQVDLLREAFDVAIRIGPLQESELNARLLGKLPLILAASPNYLHARGTPRCVEDLSLHSHVRFLGALRRYTIRFASGEEVTPPGVFDTDSGEVLRTAALSHLGIIMILRPAIARELQEQRLVPVLPHAQLVEAPIYAIHAFGRHTPARVRHFIDFTHEILNRLIDHRDE